MSVTVVCLQKMADCLAKAGLYLDEFNRLRILEPVVFQHANDLKENCKTYDDSGLRYTTFCHHMEYIDFSPYVFA